MFLPISFSCEVPIIKRKEQLQAPFRSGDGGDDEAEEGDEDGDGPALKKPASRAKAKAKAKAKTRAKAKAKQMAKPKASPKKKASKKASPKASAAKAKASPKRKSRGGKAKVDAGDSPAKKAKAEGGISKKTFAGRYVKGPHLMAMRDVFEEKIYPRLHSHSSFQNSFFKLVTSALAEAQREDREMDYDACLEIVNGQVDSFLKLEEVRNLANQSRVKKS